jgi:hypothetical protein
MPVNKVYRHEARVPPLAIFNDGTRAAVTGSYPPPVGAGRILRAGVASITNAAPNPIYDSSANVNAGITYNIGSAPYVTNEAEGEQ